VIQAPLCHSEYQIIDEIRRTAVQNDGRPLGKRRFESETGIRESDWYGGHWVKWIDALVEAGFAPNSMQKPHPQEAIQACLKAGSAPAETSESGKAEFWSIPVAA